MHAGVHRRRRRRSGSPRGTIEGRIGYEERGSEGFGYDPLFIPDELGGALTLAEVSQEEKNKVSHRGCALRALKEQLQGR